MTIEIDFKWQIRNFIYLTCSNPQLLSCCLAPWRLLLLALLPWWLVPSGLPPALLLPGATCLVALPQLPGCCCAGAPPRPPASPPARRALPGCLAPARRPQAPAASGRWAACPSCCWLLQCRRAAAARRVPLPTAGRLTGASNWKPSRASALVCRRRHESPPLFGWGKRLGLAGWVELWDILGLLSLLGLLKSQNKVYFRPSGIKIGAPTLSPPLKTAVGQGAFRTSSVCNFPSLTAHQEKEKKILNIPEPEKSSRHRNEQSKMMPEQQCNTSDK